MSHLDDLKARIDSLNEAERVEYNRRLQLLKSTKEAANTCMQALELASNNLHNLNRLTVGAVFGFASTIAAIFLLLVVSDNPNPYLIVATCLAAVVLILLNQQRVNNQTEVQRLQTHLIFLERDWAATGLEAGFMFAIIEMEKTLGANTTGYQSLQNVNSAQAAKKKTLSDYEYTLRNEIILNIQNEKDWWSKISVISGKWYEVNG